MKTKFVWIPEAPKYPGVYAPRNYVTAQNTMTMNPYDALQFETEIECKTWCANNPKPVFEPQEHGFSSR